MQLRWEYCTVAVSKAGLGHELAIDGMKVAEGLEGLNWTWQAVRHRRMRRRRMIEMNMLAV
jgi:hypothetical protein